MDGEVDDSKCFHWTVVNRTCRMASATEQKCEDIRREFRKCQGRPEEELCDGKWVSANTSSREVMGGVRVIPFGSDGHQGHQHFGMRPGGVDDMMREADEMMRSMTQDFFGDSFFGGRMGGAGGFFGQAPQGHHHHHHHHSQRRQQGDGFSAFGQSGSDGNNGAFGGGGGGGWSTFEGAGRTPQQQTPPDASYDKYARDPDSRET
eukprot:GFYU01001842.1.p1 GENE.GFYU01001842.1~~GFYU01001842.1.p1  ORF type:complete len:205 (-),score=26.40 GFYU01001842.1:55-669(-)